jgi:hypothetical protein
MGRFQRSDKFLVIADLCYSVFPNLNSENYKFLLSITGPAACTINPCLYQCGIKRHFVGWLRQCRLITPFVWDNRDH